VLGVGRPGHWQNLVLDADARKQFHKSIDPLMSWFDHLQKAPHVKLTADAGNNCMPPKEPELGKPPVVTSTDASSASAPGGKENPSVVPNFYLLRMVEDEMYSPNRQLNRTCVIVYPTGRYHLEKTKQITDGTAKAHIYLDSIEPRRVEDLKQILDVPELRDSQVGDAPLNDVFRVGTLTSLTIPRQDSVQQVRFATHLGMPHNNPDTRYVKVDSSRLLAPLRKWIKENLEDHKVAPLQDNIPTACVPTREEGGQLRDPD